jgi:hypothetical protein
VSLFGAVEVDVVRCFYRFLVVVIRIRVRSRPLFVKVSVMWIGGGMGRMFGLTGVIALT